jgi:hypothetical protein
MFIPDPGSEFFYSASRITDTGSKRFRIPDPDPHQKEFKNFNPKNCFQALGKMIWDVHPGSGFGIFPIPDPEVIKAPDPGSQNSNRRSYLGSSLTISGLGSTASTTDPTHLHKLLYEVVEQVEPHIQPAHDQHGGGKASPWYLEQSPNFKTFMEPRNRFQGTSSANLCIAWRAGTITLFLLGS